MKKIFKNSLLFAAALTLSMGAVSCSDDDTPSTPSTNAQLNGSDADVAEDGDATLEAAFKTVNEDFVNKTILPTYRALADNNLKLVNSLKKITWTK